MHLTIGGTNLRELMSHWTISNSMPVTLCVIFDTVGSMLSCVEGPIDYGNGMTHSMASICIQLSMIVIPRGDLRIFGDAISFDFPWTWTVHEVQKMLDQIPRNRGGGNGGESAIDAGVVQLRDWSDAVKVLLVRTDEGAQHDNSTDDAIAKHLADEDVLVYAVAPSSYDYCNRFSLIAGGGLLMIWSQADISVVTSTMTPLDQKIAGQANQDLLTGLSPQRLLAWVSQFNDERLHGELDDRTQDEVESDYRASDQAKVD